MEERKLRKEIFGRSIKVINEDKNRENKFYKLRKPGHLAIWCRDVRRNDINKNDVQLVYIVY